MDIKKLKIIYRRRLPDEIIEDEILARLPVKSVLRFKSVCKAWCSLFDSKQFIETHLKLSDKARGSVISGYIRVMQFSVESFLMISKGRNPMCEIRVVDGLVLMSSSWATNDLMYDFKVWLSVVGCCNGLVCLNIPGQGRFFLWNPSTRISKELPIARDVKPRHRAGFGWDKSSGAYKVCVYKNDLGFGVYSSKTNSWKTVDMAFDFDGQGQFASGKLHWRYWHQGIVWFDLKSEEFGMMELPRECKDQPHCVMVGVLEGCLCVVSINRDKRLDVWIMKEEEYDDWFHMVVDAPLYLDRYEHERLTQPKSFIALPNGQLWLYYENRYLAYDLKNNLVLPLKCTGTFIKPHFCIESLVCP